MTTLNPSNAVGFAQFRLRGGWRTLLWAVGIYTVAMGGLIAATVNVFSASGIGYSSWVWGLLALQIAIVLLFGTLRVSGAIRADLVSGMIESHRLMPAAPSSAILGYLLGATSHVLALSAANLLLGILVTVNASLPMGHWIAVNAVVIWFSLCVWAVAAMFAFAPRGMAALLYLPLMSIWMTQGAAMALLPGLTVLVSPLAGGSIFSNWAFSISTRGYPLLLGAVAQGLFALVCFIGACRKYRQADAPALTAPMGLTLIALWVGATMLAIRQWDQFRPHYFPSVVEPVRQVIASMIVTMLMALFPVSAAMRAATDWRRKRARHDAGRGRRPVPVMLIVCTATALAVALASVAYNRASVPEDLPVRLAYLLAIVALALLGPAYLLGIFYRGGGRGALPIIIWLFVVWLAPLILDFALSAGTIRTGIDFPGPLASASPPVAVYRLMELDTKGTVPGISIQAAITAILAALYYRPVQRKRAFPD